MGIEKSGYPSRTSVLDPLEVPRGRLLGRQSYARYDLFGEFIEVAATLAIGRN